MTHFLIAEVKVTDDAWVPDYAAAVHDIAAKHGGRYLARSGKLTAMEGPAKDLTLIALIQFPDEASLRAFADDPTYAPYAKARQDGSESHFTMIDDSDIAGAIPYLPKG
ncbi:MAG: DUF1330 domain-containing protein [Pseudomonadota bacterium]